MLVGQGILGLGCFRVGVFKGEGVQGLGCSRVRVF